MLAKNYILSRVEEMKANHLVEAKIKETVVPNELFFLVDEEQLSKDNIAFWCDLLNVVRAMGFRASVSDRGTWEINSASFGWTSLI